MYSSWDCRKTRILNSYFGGMGFYSVDSCGSKCLHSIVQKKIPLGWKIFTLTAHAVIISTVKSTAVSLHIGGTSRPRRDSKMFSDKRFREWTLQIVDVHRILGHKGLSFPPWKLQCETKKLLRGGACKTGIPSFRLSLVFVFFYLLYQNLLRNPVIHLFGQVLHLL